MLPLPTTGFPPRIPSSALPGLLGLLCVLALLSAHPAASAPMPAEPTKVLVTGGSGYLGQFLIDRLLQTGKHAVAATYMNKKEGICGGVEAFQVDLSSEADLLACLSSFSPDVVVNLAAVSSPAACGKDPAASAAINVPSHLISAMAAAAPKALLIQLSTDQVYDGSSPTYAEGSAARPVNAYGEQKLAFEREIADSKGASFLQFLDKSLGEAASPDRAVSLFDDEVRCPIGVHDVVGVIETAMARPREEVCGGSHGVLCMGGPERLSRMQMGAVVCGLKGYDCGERTKPSKRAALDLGFVSPLDISMDSSLLERWLGRRMKTMQQVAEQALT